MATCFFQNKFTHCSSNEKQKNDQLDVEKWLIVNDMWLDWFRIMRLYGIEINAMMFFFFVGWVDEQRKQTELGDKMDLASYLLKPVQRMGKYALLLKQLLKESGDKEPEFGDLQAAEQMVRFQLRHGNDLLAMDSLRDCDVNVKEQGRLLRQSEFYCWQGRKKGLRHVFLFEGNDNFQQS